jgi:uncharacterized protein YhhL (DUF1145 family)
VIDLVVKVTRVGVLVFWAVVALSIMRIVPQPYALVINWCAAIVALIHLAEFVLIRFGIIELTCTRASFVKTMVFGFTYWVPLLARRAPSPDVMQRQRVGNNVHDVIDDDHEPT